VALSSGVPRTVQFRLVSPASSRVTVVGDFNNWDPQASPLARGSDRGIWSVRIALPPGRYRYTFLVDGTHWVPDPSEPPAVGDDFDTPTSVITVAGGAT
jgi:1,4-alpha-glucan branching enzyme